MLCEHCENAIGNKKVDLAVGVTIAGKTHVFTKSILTCASCYRKIKKESSRAAELELANAQYEAEMIKRAQLS